MGLAPNTKYYYVCGSSDGGFSSEFSFTTVGAELQPFTFAVMVSWRNPPLRPPTFLLCFHPPACSAGILVSCGPSTADNYLPAVLCWMCSFFCSFFQGDLGQSANSSKTVSHVLSGSYTYSLLVGDLSYADAAWKQKSADLPCTPTRWDSWGRFIEPLAANMPLMVLPGNHEVEQDGAPPATQEEFVAFQKRFAMPSEASFAHNGMCCQPHFKSTVCTLHCTIRLPQNRPRRTRSDAMSSAHSALRHSIPAGNLYFSFNVAGVHFVMLNSYMDYNASSDQYGWLEKDLKAIDRTATPWVVVSMHAPWYNRCVRVRVRVRVRVCVWCGVCVCVCSEPVCRERGSNQRVACGLAQL
jgi:hypothetical protein